MCASLPWDAHIPLICKSDWLLISPYIIFSDFNVKGMKMNEMILRKENRLPFPLSKIENNFTGINISLQTA